MAERKSPPGPREMVQEHRVINSFSPPAFESESGDEQGGGDPIRLYREPREGGGSSSVRNQEGATDASAA